MIKFTIFSNNSQFWNNKHRTNRTFDIIKNLIHKTDFLLGGATNESTLFDEAGIQCSA